MVISEAEPEPVIQFLDDMIYDHNSGKTGKGDGRLFAKTARDAKENIIAGISGWLWANACEITFLWVNDKYRGKGYGELLLKLAEDEAKKNDCEVILIKSYSFQAPSFYQKHGYQVEHITNNFPPGYTYYCLVKRI